MKKTLIATVIGSITLLTSTSSFAKDYVIRIGTFAGNDHPVTHSINYFKENIEKESKGKIKVKHFPNNQLGPESVVIDQVKRGTIQMAVTGSQIKKDEVNIGLTDAPYLISTWDQARKAYNKEGIEILSGNYEANTGVKIAGYMVNGFRVISANKEISSLDQLKGLKIRIPDNEIHVHLFETLGTNNVMMPLTEVYNALETKMIDGQENPYATILTSGFYEVQNYIFESRHMFAAAPFLINKKFYDKLPKDLQNLVDIWTQKTIEYNWNLSEKNDEDSKKALKDKGVKIYEMTPEMKAQIDKDMVDFYNWFETIIPDAKKWKEHCEKSSKL